MAHTTQKTFNARSGGATYLLTVKANGGSVSIEYPVGASWVEAQSVAIDGGYIISALSQVRITPTGGAEYDVQ